MTEEEVSEKADSCISRLMIWNYLYHSDPPAEIVKRKVTLLEDTIADCQEIVEFCIQDDPVDKGV